VIAVDDAMTGARRNGLGPAPERPEGARSPVSRTVEAEGFNQSRGTRFSSDPTGKHDVEIANTECAHIFSRLIHSRVHICGLTAGESAGVV
jgi:hypothetical protein